MTSWWIRPIWMACFLPPSRLYKMDSIVQLLPLPQKDSQAFADDRLGNQKNKKQNERNKTMPLLEKYITGQTAASEVQA